VVCGDDATGDDHDDANNGDTPHADVGDRQSAVQGAIGGTGNNDATEGQDDDEHRG